MADKRTRDPLQKRGLTCPSLLSPAAQTSPSDVTRNVVPLPVKACTNLTPAVLIPNVAGEMCFGVCSEMNPSLDDDGPRQSGMLRPNRWACPSTEKTDDESNQIYQYTGA